MSASTTFMNIKKEDQLWNSVTAINTVKTDEMQNNIEKDISSSFDNNGNADDEDISDFSSAKMDVENEESGGSVETYDEDYEYEYHSDVKDDDDDGDGVLNNDHEGVKEEVNQSEEDIREADVSYSDQLIPSYSHTLENLFSDPKDPEYLALLTRLQDVEDDVMIRDSILDSYFSFKEQQKREENLQSVLQQYQHFQALASIQQQLEKEKTHRLQEEEKVRRFQMIKSLDCWITRNLRLFSTVVDAADDKSSNTEKESFLCLKKELASFVEKKQLLSYDSYCFCFSHISHIGEKHSSLLDEITDFPVEEDNDYRYE
jgi:hypothetical protein